MYLTRRNEMIEPWRGCKDEWSSHLVAAAAAAALDALEPIPVDDDAVG